MPTSSAESAGPVWLTIGIPTVPRHNHTDYLTRTLKYLMAELPSDITDPFFGKVKVLVMNNLPGQHPVFEKAQQAVQQGMSDVHNAFAHKATQFIKFIDNPGTVEDPTPDDRPEPDDFNNPKDIPGRFDFPSSDLAFNAQCLTGTCYAVQTRTIICCWCSDAVLDTIQAIGSRHA